MMMMLVFAGITALIVARLLFLTIFTDRSGNGNSANPLIPARADIVDRSGAPLARTFNAWSVGVHPAKLIGDKDDLAAKLAQLMPDKTAAEYRRLLDSKKTFVYLRRRAMPELVAAVNALGEPGLAFDREPERLYPNGALPRTSSATPILTAMAPPAWSARSTIACPIRRCAASRSSSRWTRGPACAGGRASRRDDQVQRVGAAGIIMDIHNGEVLAHDLLARAQSERARPGIDGRALQPRHARRLRARLHLQAVHRRDGHGRRPREEPGPDLSVPGRPSAGRFTINDTHPFGRPCSVAEIMQESSNIGTAQIATQVGGVRQKEYLRKMAFLEPVSIELKERGRTLSPGNNWGEISTMTVGFGHGIAVTPLHLASGYATLLNGGMWRPATLLKHGKNNPVPAGRRVFSEDTSYKMRALLRLVVTHGTGRKADAPGYRVGGKTGSAEKYHNRSLLVTTFAGAFPMEDPRYVIVAMLDEPKGIKETHGFRTAGWNVAPVISKTVSRIAPVLGVVPDSRRDANLAEVLPFVPTRTSDAMRLGDLAGIASDAEVTGFAIDHRKVAPGTVFGASWARASMARISSRAPSNRVRLRWWLGLRHG
jgi:cell division protein FtsI (penicillin-binding protein 3)